MPGAGNHGSETDFFQHAGNLKVTETENLMCYDFKDPQEAETTGYCELCGGEIYDRRGELDGRVICPHCVRKKDLPETMAAYAADDLQMLAGYLLDGAACADKTVCGFLREYAGADEEDYFRFLKKKGV